MRERSASLAACLLALAAAAAGQSASAWPEGSSHAGPLPPLELVAILVKAAEDGEPARSIEARDVLTELGRLDAVGEMLLARAYMAGDAADCGRAQAAIDRAEEKGDDSITRRQIGGIVAATIGEQERAHALLAGALEGGALDAEAVAALVDVALELGRAGEACDVALKGAARQLAFADPQYQAAQACLAAERERPALEALDLALAIDAAHRGARLLRGRRLVRSRDAAVAARGRIDLEVHSLLNRDWDLSIRSPDDLESIAERRRIDARLIELEPAVVQWKLRQAETLSMGSREDVARAHRVVVAARGDVRDRSSAALACGIAYRAGDLALAAELATQALTATPSSRPLPPARESKAATILANLLMRQSRFQEARPWLEHGTGLQPYRSNLRALTGALYAGLDENDLAIREFGIALQLGSDDPQVHKRLGLLLAGAGRREEARARLETALRSLPGDAEIQAALAQLEGSR